MNGIARFTLEAPQGVYAKAQIQAAAEVTASNVVAGSKLAALVEVKASQEYLSAVEAVLRPEAQLEAEVESINEGASTSTGAKIIVRNGPSTYDYDGDDEYRMLTAQLEAVKEKLSIRKKHMDLALQSPAGVFIGDGGEEIKAPILVKEGSKQVVITLPK